MLIPIILVHCSWTLIVVHGVLSSFMGAFFSIRFPHYGFPLLLGCLPTHYSLPSSLCKTRCITQKKKQKSESIKKFFVSMLMILLCFGCKHTCACITFVSYVTIRVTEFVKPFMIFVLDRAFPIVVCGSTSVNLANQNINEL